MLAGKPTVFLSCSEKYKTLVALPLREMLKEIGIYAVIVSEEPRPRGVSWEPDAKVQYFLNGSDSLIALCTPDDKFEDGTVQCRQNIVDEIQRARQMPHLREKILVLKAPNVKLPSNINPTYELIDPNAVSESMPRIQHQLAEWGILDKSAAEPVVMSKQTQFTSGDIEQILKGIRLGDHERAKKRAYQVMGVMLKEQQYQLVDSLSSYIMHRENREADSHTGLLIAVSLLEAINKLDTSIVGYELIEKMTQSSDFSIRSCSAMLLWGKAEAVPGEVPIDLVGRLARPNEDWYVFAPAMAATKQLILSREDAYIILEELAISKETEDRQTVVDALLDIAKKDPIAVKRSLVQYLANDTDQSIVQTANKILDLISDITDKQGAYRDSPFRL